MVASIEPFLTMKLTTKAIGKGRSNFAHGEFEESDGLSDQEVCIGDRYRVGSALFEVTHPRVACYRAGIRMKDRRRQRCGLRMVDSAFYFRVLEEDYRLTPDGTSRIGSPRKFVIVPILQI
jgi:MOSC domain-containing protein YiiM